MNIPKLSYCILLIAVLCGCCVPTPPKKDKLVEYQQVCEMCGQVWSVIPLDPETPVPPTVKWCFYDGRYCYDGMQIILHHSETKSDSKYSDLFLVHCVSCSGCRCAAFSPSEWEHMKTIIYGKQ